MDSPVASSEYAAEAVRLSTEHRDRFSARGRACFVAAQDEARALDDNHAGTEHVLLALWSPAAAPSVAVDALEAVGVTRDVLAANLIDEPGPSSEGPIPYTVRALMIGGLAGVEAARLGSSEIEPEHVLLGAIRESERWAAEKTAGPHHLRAAAASVGADLASIERELTSRL